MVYDSQGCALPAPWANKFRWLSTNEGRRLWSADSPVLSVVSMKLMAVEQVERREREREKKREGVREGEIAKHESK